MNQPPQYDHWMRRARRLAWSINLGWWLSCFAPLAFCITLAAIIPLLWLRGTGTAPAPFWASYAATLFAAAGGAVWQARRHFENTTDALARLDETLGLRNRLSAARAGVGPWPAAENNPRGKPVRWTLGRTGGLLLSSIALLATAASVPVALQAELASSAPEVPPPLAEINTWTRQLEEEQIIDPKALEELREKIDALLRHPEEDWYKAGAMEAAEHLNEQTAQTLQNLEKDLAAIENAVAQAQAFREHLPEGLAEALEKSLADALQGLDLSALPMNALQREALRQLDMKSLAKMTPAQLEALRESLKKKRDSLAKNGAMGKKKSGKNATGQRVPAFIFASDLPDPMDRLIDLVTVKNAALVRSAMNTLNTAEWKVLEQAARENRFQGYAEDGCQPGQNYEGIVLLPNPAGIPGVLDPDDDTLLDALENLILPASLKRPLTARELRAVTRALRENRLRMGRFSTGEGEGNCQGGSLKIALGTTLANCQNGGRGGRGGGPSMPLTFGNKLSDLDAKQNEALTSNDREHDTLGDIQGIGTGQHEVDETAYQGPTTGGALNSRGTGGDAVWVDNLTPEERTTLKEYFR